MPTVAMLPKYSHLPGHFSHSTWYAYGTQAPQWNE